MPKYFIASFKTDLQDNKDWNIAIWYFFLREKKTSKLISKTIRIETNINCAPLLHRAFFKTDLQDNKDWNRRGNVLLLLLLHFKTDLQDNKDWNLKLW